MRFCTFEEKGQKWSEAQNKHIISRPSLCGEKVLVSTLLNVDGLYSQEQNEYVHLTI